MLRLTKSLYEQVRRHGEETYPHECCGILLGTVQRDVRTVAGAVRCGNTRADSPHNRYHIDPGELAAYCLHALAAAGSLPSEPAVRRLLAVTMTGLRPPAN